MRIPNPGKKVQGGNLGRYEKIWSDDPIYAITVKSGTDADFWLKTPGEYNGWYWVKIYGTKDISNFVVWTCPEVDPPACPVNDVS